MNDSLISALKNRRTVRELAGGRITSGDLENLVWAAYGNTCAEGRYKMRTAPSAGATYPVELYLAAENIDDYPDGIYYYDTRVEKLSLLKEGRYLSDIRKASLNQDFIDQSNCAFLMIYNPDRIVQHYGRKSRDYALLECGHIAQNILIMAAALKFGTVPVGAFNEKRLGEILNLKESRRVLYMVCVGTLK